MSERIAIIGGGVAGLSVAMALLDGGIEPGQLTVVDGGDPRRGSACPATMLHPFPGRTMRFRRGQKDAFVRSWKALQRWENQWGGGWRRTAEMLRPLTEDERGDRLKRSWEKSRPGYPDLVSSEVLNPGQVEKKFSGLRSDVEAVLYGPAASVSLPGLVGVLEEAVTRRGAKFLRARVERFDRSKGRWTLGLDDQTRLVADGVVLAVGADLADYFPDLDLRRRAGEVAVLDPDGRHLPVLVNGQKHIFERPDGLWGLGSTYFGPEEWDERDDDFVVDRLVEGVSDVVPAAADAEVLEVWRGIRGVFGSDHMPLVGPVPDMEGLYGFAAFGSKGLLWAPAAAEDLANLLIDGDDRAINHHMDTRRMDVDKWRWRR